jgi:hypothetical protein
MKEIRRRTMLLFEMERRKLSRVLRIRKAAKRSTAGMSVLKSLQVWLHFSCFRLD